MSHGLIVPCHTKNRLYEQYERALLERVAQKDGDFLLKKQSKLRENAARISRALQELKNHEQTHCCQ